MNQENEKKIGISSYFRVATHAFFFVGGLHMSCIIHYSLYEGFYMPHEPEVHQGKQQPSWCQVVHSLIPVGRCRQCRWSRSLQRASLQGPKDVCNRPRLFAKPGPPDRERLHTMPPRKWPAQALHPQPVARPILMWRKQPWPC